MHVRGYSLTVFALVGGLVLTGLAGAPAQADLQPLSRQVAARDAGGSAHGNFMVREDNYGSTLSWRPNQKLPMGGARPEFFLDGKLLGSPLSKSGVLTLRVPGLQNAKARGLSAVSGGRVLEGRPMAAAKKAVPVQAPQQPAKLVKVDPGAKGKYATESFTYREKSIKMDGYPTRIEMKGLVVAPKGAAGKRPVVLLQHGRHATCFSKGEDFLEWPCSTGSKSIPSYRGYQTQQRLLASQGYVTVSISANSINAQDDAAIDAGSGARALLVREHLGLLAKWNKGAAAGPDVTRALRGRMNLKKVMTVGHSRGGEGVNRAALQAKAGDPFKIIGQVLIAPTDFARQVAVGTPTTVILPFCDGDVSDLQGQQYVDQGATIASGDNSLKTSVLMMGANHNYFNSYWTPGVSAAPADDDWWDDKDPACGSHGKQRLSAKEQRVAGATYVAAAARSFLTADTSAVPLLDGTPVRAASAGRAVALTAATGGKRRSVIRPDSTLKTRVLGKATAVVCDGFSTGAGKDPACFDGESSMSPHWLPTGDPATSSSASKALSFAWTKVRGSVRISGPRDLGTYRNIDLRVIADTETRNVRFTMLLRDTAGRSVSIKPERALADLPSAGGGARYWGQSVRFVLPKGSKLNVRQIASMSLVGTSKRGQVYILDGYASSSGQRTSTASSQNVARFNVKSAVVKRDPKQAEQVGYVSVPVTNRFTRNARVWVEVSDLGAFSVDSGKAYTVRPGQREIKVPVTFAGDDLYVDEEFAASSGYAVTVKALRNAVVDGYFGGLSVQSTVPRPTLSVAQPDVVAKAGGVVRWTVELSAPMGQDYAGEVVAVVPKAAGTELTLDAAVASWVNQVAPGTDNRQAFSAAWFTLPVDVPAYSTTATIEIPIRSLAKLGDGRNLEFKMYSDGLFVKKPISLRARVEPGTR